MVRKLFAHLDHKDRGKDQKDIKSVASLHPSRTQITYEASRTLAYGLFADRVFRTPRMSIRLSAGIEEWVQWERENGYDFSHSDGRKANESINPSGLPHDLRPEIKSLITHLRTHSMYFPAFESPFLKMTTTYYADESARLMKALKSDPVEFMKRCLERVGQEVGRAKEMFIEDSWEKVRTGCELALFEPSHSWVAIDGMYFQSVVRVFLMPPPTALPKLMDNEDLEKLGEMYRTFSRVKCADEVLRSFKHYVQVSNATASRAFPGVEYRFQSTVVLIVTDLPRDGEMVDRLLNFKAFVEKTTTTAFVDYTPLSTNGASTSNSAPQQYKATPNTEYNSAMRDGFQAGFSKRRNKPAEMVAKYIDRAMRKGQQSATDTEFMTLLERVLQLYRFTDDKDVFRTYFMRSLAKRLLLSRSANDAFEIAILKKLTDGTNKRAGQAGVLG